MTLVVIIIIALVFVAYRWGKIQEEKRIIDLLMELKPFEREFQSAVSDFDGFEKQNWYVSDRQFRLWCEKYQHLVGKFNPVFVEINTTDPLKQLVIDFNDRHTSGRKYIEKLNENFVRKEAPTIDKILSTKEIQHNSDQVTAIASDEDNTLLVAGAGTGKTTTILGKLAYLIERAHVKPEEILLLSFTGRAVDELTERIEAKFPDQNIKAQTFHSFGLSIIGRVLKKKPDLAFSTPASRQKFLDEQFDQQLKTPAYLHRAVEYFAYYLKPVILKPGFQTLDDYFKYAKTEQNLTLNKEELKSQQEVMIANFLFMNGIRYAYEKPYEHETADKDYRQYKPDFYLPDHDIYIEHFGVDRHGRTHFTRSEQQNAQQTRKYQSDMAWKRGLHNQYRTKLIETFSYEFTERSWKENLTENLKAHGVKLLPRDMEEVFHAMKSSGSVKEITQLFGTFLDLSKSNGYDLEKLQNIVLTRNNARELAFFEIFAPIYQAYEEYLAHHGAIDFHDMLIKASHFANDGLYRHSFRYIIIDEFQDFSVSKYVLVKALCNQNPDTKLFCVGDDWQSIFRFAGSDISLMTNFEESYGFTRKNQLVLTNRFGNGLAVISNKFILKNPGQIKKEVRSAKNEGGDVEILYRQRKSDTENLIHEILDGLNKTANAGKKTSVFLLGRYKHNKPENVPSYTRTYKNLSVEYLTIHASKGAEADYVIILDVISGKHGLPSEITDDPLLEIVLSKGDSYPHAEERRLMYVAMTRARQKVFVITEDGKESVFVLELEGTKKKKESPSITCEECGGEMIERKGPYGVFLGCTNFPDCQHKINLRKTRKY